MKRIIYIMVAVIMLICSFSLPSFALNYGSFSYEIVNDEVVITKYIGSNRTSITVPATIKEMPVVAIVEGAFKGNTELVTVKVSEGVEDIGASAFENCTSLATITLPSTIIHIGEKAIYNTAYYNNESNWKKQKEQSSSGDIDFGNGMGDIPWEDISAKNLEYLYLGKNLIEISFSGEYAIKKDTLVIADGAFAGCDAESVTLSKTLISIGNNAFKNCEKLDKITVFENIEYIGDSAFEGCTALEKMTLPDKYIELSSSSFYNTGIYNNPMNWEKDILYIGNTLIYMEEKSDIVLIKDGTKYIAGEALGENTVIIPKSVIKISATAFTDNAKATVYGYSNTFAQEYATEHSINFIELDSIIKGDVNLNGRVDEDDYRILCDVATTQSVPSFITSLVGDMDYDGVIDGTDVIILDLILNNMPPSTLKGDVNGDNKVDIEDYNLLVKIVSTSEKITDNVMFQRADVNEDGAVDAYDAVYLDLALNGLVALI